jgi:hypothetical protein
MVGNAQSNRRPRNVVGPRNRAYRAEQAERARLALAIYKKAREEMPDLTQSVSFADFAVLLEVPEFRAWLSLRANDKSATLKEAA